MEKKRLLIVEDDREIRKLLADYLTKREYEVTEAGDGNSARIIILRESFDIILMDMMLPGANGDELIRMLREAKRNTEKAHTPVIVISARSDLDTRLETMRMGADDYIIKPFDPDEVLVRIEALLRRSRGGKYTRSGEEELLEAAGIRYDLKQNEASFEGKPLKLTAKERALLLLFLRSPDKTFTKANLYESVWEDVYYCEDNTVNVHMSNLRSKLKSAAGRDLIETVWGIGYRLKEGEHA
ncbi:MAG: response regulator transcription factor [Lachnospiraceae bacterium]|nr:response regulator transcription factor [Lachnospiraceae bacterium]